MMKTSVAVLAVAAAVLATVVFAQNTTEISITECSDHQCKTGCRTIAKMPAGKCHTQHFSQHGSFEAMCAPAPANALCVYAALFRRNETDPAASCTDNNTEMIGMVQCGVCRLNHMMQMERVDCTATGANVTVHLGCNADCSTCNHTYSVPEQTCINPTHRGFNFAVGYSRPEKCSGEVRTSHWNASTNCQGTPAMTEVMFQKACYGMHGRSHYFQCS